MSFLVQLKSIVETGTPLQKETTKKRANAFLLTSVAGGASSLAISVGGAICMNTHPLLGVALTTSGIAILLFSRETACIAENTIKLLNKPKMGAKEFTNKLTENTWFVSSQLCKGLIRKQLMLNVNDPLYKS